MSTGNAAPTTETAVTPTPKWWATPLAATAVALVVDAVCLVTTSKKNAQGAGPHQGMAAVAVFFFALVSLCPLFVAWAAAVVSSERPARQVQARIAMYVFLVVTLLVQLVEVAITAELVTNSIGGK